MDDFCHSYGKALYATDREQKRVLFVRARCKQWSCAYCADVNRRQWQKRLIEGVKKLGGSWSFWTLTHDMPNAPYIEQRKRLTSAWNRLIGQIKYHAQSGDVAYVRVIEIGTNATRRMHLHILINYVPDDLLKVDRRDGTHYWKSESWFARAEKAGFGRIADIRSISGTDDYQSPEIALGSDLETTRAVLVASYVTKYMSKTDESTEKLMPVRTRRFSASRNFPKLEDEKGFTRYKWRPGNKPDVTRAESAWKHGHAFVDVQRDGKISYDDFDEFGEYIY